MPLVAPATASRLGFALAACVAAVSACHGPDPYYRAGDASGAGGSGMSTVPSGKAGTTGAAGTGAAGTVGAAGAVGAAGTGSNLSGVAGTGGPCTTCKVTVQYTCRRDREETKLASFVLDVTNDAKVPIALSDLTVRYWYVAEIGKEQWLECDFAELGCSNISSSTNQLKASFVKVLPPRMGANMYAEIGFSPGALTLDPFLNTGEIQLRLHNQDFTEIDQTDDYSFDDSLKGNPVAWKKITAYIKGVLVWGTEPP